MSNGAVPGGVLASIKRTVASADDRAYRGVVTAVTRRTRKSEIARKQVRPTSRTRVQRKSTEPQRERMLTVRVPIALLDRADALIDAIAADVDTATALGARVTRSSVLRLMLVEGAKALERRYR